MLTTRHIGESGRDRAFTLFINIMGFLALFVTAYPLFFVVIASISDPHMVASGKVWFYPRSISLKGYQLVFNDSRVWIGYRNTIFYSITGTLINLLLTLPAAYALSRKDFLARNAVMFYLIVTMFFSGGLIPTYFVVRNLKMLDTVWALLIPSSVSVFNIIIARTFFQANIPGELKDSAEIDGCSTSRFFIHIVIPLSKAIIAVIALYCAVGHWNQYYAALIYIRNRNLITLQLSLRDILITNVAFEQTSASINREAEERLRDIMKYALIIVSALPILMVYPFMQKYFTKGVMIGSIKG